MDYMYDEATAFRTIAQMATALNADGDSATVDLGRLVKHTGLYADKLSAQKYTVVVVVEDAPVATDETYTLNIKATDGTVLEALDVTAAPGTYVRHFDRTEVDAADPDGTGLTIGFVGGGTGNTHALKYAAWLV